MSRTRIHNVNIVSAKVLPSPAEMQKRIPMGRKAGRTVFAARQQIRDILDRRDPRLFAIVGPCSIHDVESGLDYAHKLKALSDRVSDTFLVVMRVYFEKPRTTVGWKGFINDPDLDDSFNISRGLDAGRRFLLRLAEMGLPAATEALDPITPQYIGDFIAWTAIGARTTESQKHREMASGLSTPVGFKNGTDGNVDVAVSALISVSRPHHFLGVTEGGRTAVFHTRGNPYAHLVLRGGARSNYHPADIARCENTLRAAGLPVNIMVDCSHGNSRRDPGRQLNVLASCVRQVLKGNQSIVGFMLESNLLAGKQDVPSDPARLRPGVSITDACLDWPATETAILRARDRLGDLPARAAE